MMGLLGPFLTMRGWETGVTLLLLAALPTAAMAQPSDNQGITGTQDVPYQLLIPLLQPFPFPGSTTQLQVGSEIPNLPVELPIPDSGVLQWSLSALPQYITLVFEIEGDRAQFEAAYLEQLQASGWTLWEPEFPSGSETVVDGDGGSNEFLLEQQAFCQEGNNVQLSLEVFQPNLDTTQLSAYLLIGGPYSDCDRESTSFAAIFPELDLSPPDNSQVQTLGGGGSNDDSEYQTQIQTSLSIAALANHYADEMRQQGWILEGNSGNDLLYWSTWSRSTDSDSPQRATIYLLATEDPELYLGTFRAGRIAWQTSVLNPFISAVEDGLLPQATAVEILRDQWQISDSEDLELWLEQLPPALSTELALPPEMVVLGGMSYASNETAVLETSLPTQTLRTLYSEALASTGWERPEVWNIPLAPVFETSATFIPDVFCQLDGTNEIMLSTRLGQNNLTTVYINRRASTESASPCLVDPEVVDSFTNRDYWANQPFPTLQIPLETSVLPGGFRGSGNSFDSDIYIYSQLAADDLAAHYIEQMDQSGWEQQTVTQTGGSFVGIWQFETETGVTWQGLFSLIAQPESGQWRGHFSASTDSKSERDRQ